MEKLDFFHSMEVTFISRIFLYYGIGTKMQTLTGKAGSLSYYGNIIEKGWKIQFLSKTPVKLLPFFHKIYIHDATNQKHVISDFHLS